MNLREQSELRCKVWREERKEEKQCNYILISKINVYKSTYRKKTLCFYIFKTKRGEDQG